jgi:site-specific DNA-cytosine methylase/intein/homing endonuclease
MRLARQKRAKTGISIIEQDGVLFVDAFAGGGGASTGVEMAIGRSVDVAINHNPVAIAMHAKNHPDARHYIEDVFQVDPVEACRGKRPKGMWMSPDCFPAGTLILAKSGLVPIENLKIGDEVLTHLGRWRAVTDVMRSRKELLRIRGQGHPGLMVSGEHPFYVRERRLRAGLVTLEEPKWMTAKQVGKNVSWATPSFVPGAMAPEVQTVQGRRIDVTKELLWLAGRYVADGWTRIDGERSELVITCGHHKTDSLRARLSAWNHGGDSAKSKNNELSWYERDTSTAHQFSTNSKGLVEWLRSNFGHKSEAKTVPAWLLGSSREERESFLEGYVSGDGHVIESSSSKLIEVVTVSKSLAIGIKMLVASLGSFPAVYQSKNSDMIQGRAVKSKPVWRVRWRLGGSRTPSTLLDSLHSWSPVKEVTHTGTVSEVFNISVDEDESYVADGIVVHNCKHFSRAKGGKPREKKIRALAWLAIRWARTVRPEIIFLENVPEFKTWGPVDNDGVPIKEKAGKTFRLWINKLKSLGYEIDHRELVAADYGAPTSRKRFYLIARCDGKPIVWPEPTHGKGRDKPWRSASECIDWSLPCKSIFNRKKPLAPATMARIAAGLFRFVLQSNKPFVVPLTHQGNDGRVYDIDQPIPTVTGANRGEMAVISPIVVNNMANNVPRPANEPLATILTGGHKILATATLRAEDTKAAFVVSHYGESVGREATEPAPTVTAGGQGHSGVDEVALCPAEKPISSAPFLATVTHTKSGDRIHSADEPLNTVTTAKGGEFILVSPTLIQTGYGERPGQAPRALDIDAPLGTVVSSQKRAVVTAFISKAFGGGEAKMSPGSSADDPIGAITVKDHNHLIQVSAITKFYGTSTGANVEDPLPTVTSGGEHLGVVSATLEASSSLELALVTKFRKDSAGSSMEDPLPTVTANSFIKRPGGAAPLGIVTAKTEPVSSGQKRAKNKKAAKQEAPEMTDKRDKVEEFLSSYRDKAQAKRKSRSSKVREKHSATEKSLGTVMIHGIEHHIVDIGMRMLQPHELFLAQGFPRDYALDVEVEKVRKGKKQRKKLTKTELIALCGNAVCPPVAEAIVKANYFL